MKSQFTKFTHKTPHLGKKQHQLDPNLDLKQLVHHSTVQYVDRDADGDVDVYDNPKKPVPDENPIKDFDTVSKKLIAKQKGEIKHTRRGMAYEDLRKWFGTGGEGGVGGGGWDRYNTKGERIGKCAREPGEGKPKCLSKEKASKMSKDEIAAAVRRKRKADPVADRPGKGGKPKMVSNKIKEETHDSSLPDWNGPMFSVNEKRFCPKCQKNETQMECRYGPKYWALYSLPSSIVTNQMKYDIAQLHPANEQKDHEHSMARSELSTVMNAAKRLKKKMGKGEGNIEAWVQSKITKAADYLDAAADYLDSGEHNVHGSMDEEKGPCWTGYKQVGMKKKGKRMVPNCVPEHTGIVGKILEQIAGEEELQTLEEKNVPTNPALWSKMKSRAKAKFDVYPSAYANGWAAKEYKKAGGGWKSVSEEVELEEAVRIPSKTGNLVHVMLTWKGKYYSLKMFFPQVSLPSRKDVQDQVEKVYPGSKVQSYHVVEYQPGEPIVHTEGAAWTRREGQNKEGGLNEKGRKSYERENPGSDLKAPSKKVGNPRRASFCARMQGMKKKLTSSKTANDPNSRINKSLRAWNC
jgi:hypothetical protein